MKLIYLLLAVALVLNPVGCAHNITERKGTERNVEDRTGEERKGKEVSAGGFFKFVGYLCLFGLFSPSAPTETEYITEVDGKDGVYEPQRKYKKEKGR